MEFTGMQKEVNAERTVSHPYMLPYIVIKMWQIYLLLEMNLEMIEDKYIATPTLQYAMLTRNSPQIWWRSTVPIEFDFTKFNKCEQAKHSH